LRVVLAAVDDTAAYRVAAALHPDTVEVRLHAVMTLAETQDYVRQRLKRAGAPPVAIARFDQENIERIHRLSGGAPRRVHELAAEMLGDSRRSAISIAGDEDWLGEPIGDADDELALGGDDFEPFEDSATTSREARQQDLGFLKRVLRRDS
jgi:hypothetical protein